MPPWPARPPLRPPFKGRLLRGGRRPRMPRPRRLDGPADPPQRFPAALRMHLRQAETPRHPDGHLGAAPHPTVLGRHPYPLGQGGQHIFGQQRGGAAIPPPLVAERLLGRRRCSAPPVLPPSAARRPAPRRPRRRSAPAPAARSLGGAAPPWIPCRPVSCFQLLEGQMLDDPRDDAAPEPWSTSLPPAVHHRNRQAAEAISRRRYHAIRFTPRLAKKSLNASTGIVTGKIAGSAPAA